MSFLINCCQSWIELCIQVIANLCREVGHQFVSSESYFTIRWRQITISDMETSLNSVALMDPDLAKSLSVVFFFKERCSSNHSMQWSLFNIHNIQIWEKYFKRWRRLNVFGHLKLNHMLTVCVYTVYGLKRSKSCYTLKKQFSKR